MNDQNNLLQTFERLLQEWRPVFSQERTFDRARRLGTGLLVCLRAPLTTNAITAVGRHYQDWSGDYRVMSRSPWDPRRLFDVIFRHLPAFLPPNNGPVLVALDDTSCRKTGRKIPGVSTLRDPRSLPYHVNLYRGHRFVQISVLLFSLLKPGPARAIPVRFEPAPVAAQPKVPKTKAGKKAKLSKAAQTELQQQQEAYEYAKLPQVAVRGIASVRHQLDQSPATADSPLVVLVDASYTNKNVLPHLPERTVLIGRIRKDARLNYPLPDPRPAGTHPNQRYGPTVPTPDQLLHDKTVPFVKVQAFAAGQVRSFEVKVITPLVWRKAGPAQLLQLVVIKPVGYRLSLGSRVLYREPAFLICTDPDLPLAQLLQAYLYRWEIECNHRDEKSYLGVDAGHVRSPQSVTRLPQFQVALYSLLQLATLITFGFGRTADFLPLPKWRNRPPVRPSINDILNLFRSQLFNQALSTQAPFSDFANLGPQNTNGLNPLVIPRQLALPAS